MIHSPYKVINQVGVIENIGYAYVTIAKEDWAPGIWAGVHDVVIGVKPADCEVLKCSIHVTYCDLENRRIYHKVSESFQPGLVPGDRLLLKVTVEDGR